MTDIIMTTSSEQNDVEPPAKKPRIKENNLVIQELFKCLHQTGPLVIGPVAKSHTLLGIIGASLPKVSSENQDAIKRAKKYAMKESVKMVLMKQTLAHQQNQMASQRNQVQRQQALALMCRIYVGSISFELKEDSVREAFMPFGPIKSVNMSWDLITQKHKGFAFVEYDIPEAAQLALDQMNGVMIGGRNIKVVGRPSNMPQAQSIIDNIIEESKHYNRIYISSIHRDIEENDIKSVFEAFGPIKHCQLFRGNSANRDRNYAYIEYQTMQSAVEAISSMNLFDLGGVCLRVGIAITPPNVLMESSSGSSTMPTAAAVAAATATAKIQAMDAVASNAVALGLTKIGDSDPPYPEMNSRSNSSPTAASIAPVIPPPGVVIPQMLSSQPMGTQYLSGQSVVIPPPTLVAPTSIGTLVVPVNNSPTADATKRAKEQAQQKQQEELQKKLLEETEVQTLQQQENLTIKGPSARHLVMQKLMRRIESRVIVLKNMTSPEDVDELFEEEIKEECSKYGVVNKVVIYNERQSEDDDAEVIVKIFVEFSNISEAERAKNSLNGRYFDKRLITCEFYDQALYDYSDFSG